MKREEVKCITEMFLFFVNMDFMAVVVFRGNFYAPHRFAMQDPVGSVSWIYMGDRSCAGLGERGGIVIKLSHHMEMG